MAKPSAQELGERELAKIARREAKHAKFLLLCQHAVAFIQAALLGKHKLTSQGFMVGWDENEQPKILDRSDRNIDHDAYSERNPDGSVYIITSVCLTKANDHYATLGITKIWQIWTSMETWQNRLFTQALTEGLVDMPSNVAITFVYMDCRGATGPTFLKRDGKVCKVRS